MSPRDLALLVLLAGLWGSSFLFMRIAGPELGAAPLAWMRVTVAAVFLGALLAVRRESPPLSGRWGAMTLMAFTNTAAPFLLLTWATIHLSAGYGALLNATTPLWGAVIGTLFFGLAAGRQLWAGLALGFVGVGVLVAGKLNDIGSAALLPILAGLAATACYGHAAHYARTGFNGVTPLGLAFGSQLLASLWLLGPALAEWPAAFPSWTALACVLFLGVACTGIAYLIYFGLIARIGSTKATMVTYIAPVFGVAWGALLLKEAITAAMLAGGAVILIGVAVAGRARKS
ncbi:DMT family transporter [Silanimonas sp.]|jgi:drug/metabolite transporter (DMT)-like permease|uniref:DMT family transporter n=1 Tax=Silanimonas sp. TaxID=1929290 RepID=UPI0022C256A1|nr:DMT family transporter [Silanimonas sp.]MCZ8115828.1 DMT family transporter [Silanimonas sp.]